MVQLKAEHRMAKRTVANVLRNSGVTIRPQGGQPRTSLKRQTPSEEERARSELQRTPTAENEQTLGA